MFPVAVTTETSGTGSAVRCCLVLLIRLLAAPCHRHPVCGVVGGGLGVDRIVDASRLAAVLSRHPYVPSLWRAGGCGGCCLCRPISTSQLETVAGLPLLAYQPSSLLGAYQEGRVLLVETLS